jgi:hypothetical protein
VMCHEVGHVTGLDDLYGSSDAGKMMYGYYSYGQIKRTLSTDDINGISTIYPGNKAEAQGVVFLKPAPNPFKPTHAGDYVLFTFDLYIQTHIRIDIFNIAGELVKTLLDQDCDPGVFEGASGIKWYGDNGGPDSVGTMVGSGVYICQLRTSSGKYKIQKVMVIR